MPIYEYACDSCGNVEEVLQKFSDSPLTTCAKCSGELHKLISQSSFHLKGSGWYVTDYAGKSGNSASTGSAAKSEKKSDDSTKTQKTEGKTS